MSRFISEEDREGKKEALRKLMDTMKMGIGKKLGGFKKPMTEREEEAEEDYEMASDSEDLSGDFGDMGPSPEEKEKIAELYHKYCHGK